MVKLLTDLKVAEIREALAARHESTEGKKAELLQRLSDWIEDNDFDPDTYDFAAADVPQRKQSSDEFSNSEPGNNLFFLYFHIMKYIRTVYCRRKRTSICCHGRRGP